MSVVTELQLCCDCAGDDSCPCPEQIGTGIMHDETSEETELRLREAAADLGWALAGIGDVCPGCMAVESARHLHHADSA